MEITTRMINMIFDRLTNVAQPKKTIFIFHTHIHAHKHAHTSRTHFIRQFLDPYTLFNHFWLHSFCSISSHWSVITIFHFYHFTYISISRHVEELRDWCREVVEWSGRCWQGLTRREWASSCPWASWGLVQAGAEGTSSPLLRGRPVSRIRWI